MQAAAELRETFRRDGVVIIRGAVPLAQVAQLRLARILHAKGDDQGALAIIDEGSHGEYAAAYDELRGDIQYRAGQIEAARDSYDQALQRVKEGQAANSLVRMKLQSLPGGAQACSVSRSRCRSASASIRADTPTPWP